MVEFNYQIKSARRELNIRQNREVSIMKHKLVSVVLAAAMLASSLTGCGSKAETTAKNDSGAITLKVFSNLPDRKNGQGLVEQMIIDNYMKENTNVKIEVEALDEEAYKTKFKAYSMEGMPDVVSIWGQPSFLDEVLDAGVLAELNEPLITGTILLSSNARRVSRAFRKRSRSSISARVSSICPT